MKTGLITGVSSGIGQAAAEFFLQQGFTIYGISRRKPEVENAHFHWVQLDLANLQKIEVINQLIPADQLDFVINNAGTAFEHPALNLDAESFEAIFNLNFRAPIQITQHLINKLSGSLLINISSISDRIPEKGYGLYCASKAALNIYFDTVALEQPQVKVMSVLPDYVDTPLLRKLIGDTQSFDWQKAITTNQMSELLGRLVSYHQEFESGSHIIVVNTSLEEDLNYHEKLWAYKADTQSFQKLH